MHLQNCYIGGEGDRVIKTKELVREHLEEELLQIWSKPLMIITAPSGYGKTTLLNSFLKKQAYARILWLALGQEVVDEVWVWKILCEKCCEVNTELGQKLREMGLPKSAQETDYIRDIICSYIRDPVCLVIDDFQECNSSNINRLLTRLTYDRIPDFHIVLVSRIYPELPYEELFLRGYCATVDQVDLSLSREETEEIFRINGITLGRSESEALYEYTDGWISAVYLALYEYSRNGSMGTFTSASHLLKTAIFDKLSPVLQELYVKLSLFDSFTLQAAVYIAETDILPSVLTEAVETYGFMQYNPVTGKYRMHSLLRMVASRELERRHIDKKYIYSRGGEWYERSEEYMEAVAAYRNAGNYRAILKLLSTGNIQDTVFEFMPKIMKEIFRDIPVQIKAEYPVAWLGYIYNVVMRIDAGWGRELYEEACLVYGNMQLSEEKRNYLEGELLIIGAMLEFNDLERTNKLLKRSYRLLGSKPSGIFHQTLMSYGVPFMTLLYYRRSGDLKKTIELEKEHARYYVQLLGMGDGNWDELFDAEYALLVGDLERAGQLAEQVQKKAIYRKQPCVIINSYYIKVKSLIYTGAGQQLEKCLKELSELREKITKKSLVIDADMVHGYGYASLGEKEKMADWLRDFNLEECSWVVRNARSGCMAYGMLLCRKQDWVMLDSIADQILVPYGRTKHSYALIRGYLYKAIALFHLEDRESAYKYLSMAVAAAEPDEVRLPFIENSVELFPIMECITETIPFLEEMLPYMQKYRKSFRQLTAVKEAAVLTERENELLELVKNGYRNSDISKTLNIALVTVEKTLTAVYRKLGVTNRTAAVEKWKAIKNEK